MEFTTTLLLALVGYLVTYIVNLSLTRRADRLKRVNLQLRELYGPMYTLTQATQEAWDAYTGKYWDDHSLMIEHRRTGTTEEKKYRSEIWRRWTKHVFMPLNRQLYDLIINKGDLLVESESEMPPELLAFIAHVSSYEAVLAQWDEQDYSELFSVINFPKALSIYAEIHFKQLLDIQSKLLQTKHQSYDPSYKPLYQELAVQRERLKHEQVMRQAVRRKSE